MNKMTKIILALISIVCAVSAYASGDALTACGVPQFLVDAFGMGSTGVSVATAAILPLGEQQTGLVIAYKNRSLIADEVMPVKVLEGNSLSFKWYERTLGDAFGTQDTRVGRMSAPNIVHFSGEEKAGLCKAYGLKTPVPREDIDQIVNKDRFVNSQLVSLTDRILLDREVRVAGIVQNPANYASGQSHTCTEVEKIGASNFDFFEFMMQYIEGALVRPNVLGMSSKVFWKLRTDKSIINAIYPQNNGSGVVTREQLAALFEVDKIIVGQARVNTNKNPKAPNLTPCWGEHIWGHYQEALSTLTDGLAWGMTAQVGERYTEIVENTDIGLKGGEDIKVGFYQDEIVTAKGAGFLLKDVL